MHSIGSEEIYQDTIDGDPVDCPVFLELEFELPCGLAGLAGGDEQSHHCGDGPAYRDEKSERGNL